MRRSRKIQIFVMVLAAAVTSSIVMAQQIRQPMTFTVHDPCGGGKEISCAPVIIGNGTITSDTADRFREVARTAGGDVILISPGGSLAGGVALGRAIRASGLNTRAVQEFTEYTPKRGNAFDYDDKVLFKNGTCMSACAYAFLGGVKRTVESDRVLGIHQFRSERPSASNLEEGAQAAVAGLQLYAQEMGVSVNYISLASTTSASDIFFISRPLAKSLGVDNSAERDSGWSVKTTPAGQPMLDIRRTISPSRSTFVRIIRDGNRVRLFAAVVFNTKFSKLERLKIYPFDELANISIQVDGVQYSGQEAGKWTKAVGNNTLSFGTETDLPLSILSKLANARTVAISDDFGNAMSDVSLSTELSTIGLQNGANLLLRYR